MLTINFCESLWLGSSRLLMSTVNSGPSNSISSALSWFSSSVVVLFWAYFMKSSMFSSGKVVGRGSKSSVIFF